MVEKKLEPSALHKERVPVQDTKPEPTLEAKATVSRRAKDTKVNEVRHHRRLLETWEQKHAVIRTHAQPLPGREYKCESEVQGEDNRNT